MWILKGLKIHMPVGADEKLRLIVKGRDFAALDQDSQSRDTQFELRIASYFCQSGCEVDMTTDTDVIARTDRHAFFVECKRVGSKSKLRARISEARGQLAQRMPSNAGDRSLLGCIAVDVTRVAFTHNGLTMGVTNEHSRDVIQKKLVQIATEANHLMSFESCKGLLCYWLQIHIPALIMNPLPATSTTRFSSYHIQRPSLNWKDEKTLATFYVLFESVSKGDVRALPSQILTPRQVINFPAGTTYSLQGNQVIEFLAKEIVSEEDQAEIIGTLTLSGTEHKFTFFEVSLIPNELIEKWRCEMSGDQAKGSLMLLAILYLRRYPYEES
jgi:hypothetical protein